MAIYNRKARRATKKRGTRTSKAAAEAERRRKKRSASARVAPAKRQAKARAKKRATARRASKKRVPTAKARAPKPKRVKPKARKAKPRKSAAKPKPKPRKGTPKPRKRAAKAVRKPKAAKAKAKAKAKPKKLPTIATAARRTRRRREEKRASSLEKRLEAVRKKQEQAREKGKRSPERLNERRERREFEKKRGKTAPILPLPKPSPQRPRKDDVRRAREKLFRDLYEHMLRTGQGPARYRFGAATGGRAPYRFESRDNVGEQRLVRIGRILTLSNVEQMIHKVNQAARRMSGLFALWYASVVLSGFGDRLVGSGNRLLRKTDDPNAPFFTTEAYDNTGLRRSYPALEQALRELLEGQAETANTVVFVHSILVRNFDRKRGRA